jgi:hypothetical protein
MTLPPANPESPPPNTPDSSPSHFIVEQMTPESITNALPILVTITNHGLSNGQFIRATKFYNLPIAVATGMYQLNNKQFMVQQCTDDTFILCDNNSVPIDGRNYTPYVQGGEFTLVGQSLGIVNPAPAPPSGIPAFPPE